MFGNDFYNQTTRRLVAVFGTHFNDIRISRIKKVSGGEDVVQKFLVPISYGPTQKFLAKNSQDPDFRGASISLPRMSFELTGLQYIPERKLIGTQRLVGTDAESEDGVDTIFVPAPYDLNFTLHVMVKYNEDGMKIVEQIIPFFKPSITPSVKLLDEVEKYFDIPITLTGVNHEDNFDGAFTERRILIWTLEFTMNGYYFGATSKRKVIKFAKATVSNEIIETYPQIKGEPDILPINIDETDDYVIISEYNTYAIVLSSTQIRMTESNIDSTYTVRLSNEPNVDIVVGLLSSDTGAATISPTSITFTSENYHIPISVSVTSVADSNVDNEVVTINHTVVTNESSPQYNGKTAKMIVTIEDNSTG